MLFRRTGPGPSTLLLCEILGALRCSGPAHAPGRAHTATPPPLCQHHVQLYWDVEVSLVVCLSLLGVSGGLDWLQSLATVFPLYQRYIWYYTFFIPLR